jgi:hypothetical protein
MEEQEIYSNTIYRVVHGSRAYGTHRPDSDYDEKGICIPTDPRYYYGTKKFEQKDKGWEDGNDRVIFDIRKFFALALKCNPNVLEILYVDDSDIITIDELGKELRDNRDMFLSRKALGPFVGFANDQLHRIKGHKSWHHNAPSKPNEADYWYMHALSHKDKDFAREFDNHKIRVHAPTPIALPDNLAAILKDAGLEVGADAKKFALEPPLVHIDHFNEAGFKAAKKKYRQYCDWLKNRNPDRAAIEAEHGFDRKNAYQLVRLLRMGKEIITEGKVQVRRPDAQELLDIRHGRKFTYDELVEYAESLTAEVKAAVDSSPLPEEPDREKAEKLLLKLIKARVG